MGEADVEDDAVCTHRLSGKQGSIEDKVRPRLHDHPVLVAQGLALGAVHQDDGPSPAATGDRTPLGSDREGASAAAAQAAALEHVDEAGAAGRHRAETFQMVGDVLCAAVDVGARQQIGSRHRPVPNPVRDAVATTPRRSGRAARPRPLRCKE